MPATASQRELILPFTPRAIRRPSRIRFEGALDAYTVGEARARIDAMLRTAPRAVIVDLEGLRLLDAVGVRALVTLHERVTSDGAKVAFVNVTDQPLMVLQLCGLKAAFGL